MPNRFIQFLSGMGKLLFQTKFSAVVSSLGHLSIKNFQTGPTVLALLDKGMVLRGGGGEEGQWQPHHPHGLFS